MDGIKQECQKFYDLLSSAGPGGQGHTIELIMRTLDQDGTQATQNCVPNSHNAHNSNSSNNHSALIGGMQMTCSEEEQLAAATLELHPNIVLQSLGMPAEEEDSSTSNNSLGNNNNNNSNSSGGGRDRPFICQVCHASYKTRTHLRRHMFIHLNNRPYPCTECGKGFNRKEHLNKHIEAVHSGTKHKCQYCGKEISRKDHLSRHIKNMHPNLAGITKDGDSSSVLQVQLPCGQKQQARLSFLPPTFPPASTLPGISKHSLSKSNKNDKQSHKINGQEVNIEDHPQDSHHIGHESFQQFTQVSIVPGGSIVVPGALPGQIAATVTVGTPISTSSGGSNAGAQKNNSSLNQNGLESLTNLSLTLGGQIREAPFAHCESNNGKKITQVFNCTECSTTFSSEKEYSAHVKSHKPQNYRCTDCPRAYTRREKLTEHIRCFHQGQKFKCEYCGKELSRKDHVLRHVRSIHPEVLASRFTAHLQENVDCGQDGVTGLLSSSGISSSAAMNEMGVLLRSVCHVCLKVFGTSYHLGRHIESCHNGDIRPYSCSSCSKQFKRKDHLTKHMKSHCPSTRDGNDSNSNPIRSKGTHGLNKAKNERNGSSSGSKGKKTKNGNNSNVKHDIHQQKTEKLSSSAETDADFNLAMINSFIADNVNVVVEEGDLSSLGVLINPDLQQQTRTTSTENSSSENRGRENIIGLPNEGRRRDSLESLSSQNNHSQQHQNHMNTLFPCGHCQKEFSSRDQLLDHLQHHTAEESNDGDVIISSQERNSNVTVHQLATLQFSAF